MPNYSDADLESIAAYGDIHGGQARGFFEDLRSARAELSRRQSLAEMGTDVVAWCNRKGWEPDPARTFGDEIALIHSEASEALEHYRDIGFSERTINDKPEDVASEFADILIRLLHYSTTHGIDLEYEYKRKMAYNEGRPWRHGGRAL